MQAFMELLLGRLLATSIHAIALAAVVWGLCRCLRLPPAAQCWLWWLVALQAVMGLCLPPLRLPWLAPVAAREAAFIQGNIIPMQGGVLRPLASLGLPLWSSLLLACWATGLALMAGLTLRQWQRMRALLRGSVPCNDALLLQSLALAASDCGLRRAPRLHFSCDIESPVLAGFFRPVLLLPANAALSADELDMAIAHELTHLRRHDLWWGCLPALARQLFFFHPFVHLAVREYGIAREAACDARVVAVERHSRRDYGDLLLRLAIRPASVGELAVASPTFHALRRRLTMLQNTTFLSRTLSLPLVLLVAAAGVVPMRLVAAAAATPAPAAAAPAAGAPAVGQKAYSGARMSADFKDTDVREVLKLIGDTSGRNILVSDRVTGKITVRMKEVRWDELLDIVLTAKGLEKRVQNDLILVYPAAEQR